MDEFIDTALASTQYAINASVHSTTKESPGAFGYDDAYLVCCKLGINQIKNTNMAHWNFLQENDHRKQFDWQVGMEVLLDEPTRYKLNPKSIGHFSITQVHTNGTFTTRKSARAYQ